MTSSVVVTGANGVLGSYIKKQGLFGGGLFPTREDLDVSYQEKVQSYLKTKKPEVIVHAAAATHIDHCEKDRDNGKRGRVWKTNVLGTQHLIDYCKKNDCHLVFLSTECVFDGRRGNYSEEALTNPKNWYGTTKAEAEARIAASDISATIIRSVLFYHPEQLIGSLVSLLMEARKSKKPVKLVNDLHFSPTFLDDLVKTILWSSRERYSGVLHVAPETSYTPYEFGIALSKHMSLTPKQIEPVGYRQLFSRSGATLRLKHATLNGTKTRELTGLAHHSIEELM